MRVSSPSWLDAKWQTVVIIFTLSANLPPWLTNTLNRTVVAFHDRQHTVVPACSSLFSPGPAGVSARTSPVARCPRELDAAAGPTIRLDWLDRGNLTDTWSWCRYLRTQHQVFDLRPGSEPVNHLEMSIVSPAKQGPVVGTVFVCAHHKQAAVGFAQVVPDVGDHRRQDNGWEISFV